MIFSIWNVCAKGWKALEGASWNKPLSSDTEQV